MNYKIAHVAFTVKDMKKSLEFYVDKLGLTHSFSINNNEDKPWIEYLKVCDGQFLELFYANADNVFAQNHSYAHLCLQVEDINECAQLMREKGIVLDTEPMQGKDLNWQCWISDPDKNPIEFMQIDKNSQQAKA